MDARAGTLRKRLRAFAQAGLVTLAVLLASLNSPPAEAGLQSCMDMAGTALDIAQLATDPQTLQCAGKISGGDIPTTLVAAAFVALMAMGKFDSKAECSGMVDDTLAMPIAALLSSDEAAAILKPLIGTAGIQQLKDIAAGTATSGLSSIPALQPVLGMIGCGCAIAGTAAELRDKLKQQLEEAKECASAAADLLLAGLESGATTLGKPFEMAGEWVHGGEKTGAQSTDYTVTVYPCSAGYHYGTSGFGGDPSFITPVSGEMCFCPQPSSVAKSGVGYYCQCPSGQGYSGGSCGACPNGVPGPDGACKTCQEGSAPKQPVSFPLQCTAACALTQIWDKSTHQCKTCPDGTEPKFNSLLASSNGSCQACQPGYSSKGGAFCKSNCKSWEKWNTATKQCEARCPTGQQYQPANPGTKNKSGLIVGYSPEACIACGANMQVSGSTGECVACPKGASWHAAGDAQSGSCSCPSGQSQVGSMCIATGPQDDKTGDLDLSKSKGKLNVDQQAPPGSPCGGNTVSDPKLPNHCIPCPAGKQPNSSHTVCLVTLGGPRGSGAGSGGHNYGGAWGPARSGGRETAPAGGSRGEGTITPINGSDVPAGAGNWTTAPMGAGALPPPPPPVTPATNEKP